MQIVNRHELPAWFLRFVCTNPWCLAALQATEKDVKFSRYPDHLGLSGEGFYLVCPACGKAFAIHRSILFPALAERLNPTGQDVRA